MAKPSEKRDRLSIDIRQDEHRQIKAYAVLHGLTIRKFILECIRERLRREKEKGALLALVTHLDEDAVLKELWNNEKDAAYDKL